MSAGGSIQWGRILLSAILAAVMAMALIIAGLWLLGQNPGGIFDDVCPPDLVDCPDTGNIIGDIIGCAILFLIVCLLKIALYALLVYFPLAAIISILLIMLMVQQRRLIHIILTVIVSIPVAFGLLWLVGRIA
jgi:uncharacterized membrane protein YfbV (UPF0208 family)